MITPEKRLRALATLFRKECRDVEELPFADDATILFGSTLDEVDLVRIHACIWGENEAAIDRIIDGMPVVG